MTTLAARVILAAAVGLASITAVVYAATRDGDETGARQSEESWAALAPSPLERTEVGAARVGDRVYVVGGYISSGGTTGRMVRYDISDDRWAEVAPLPIGVNHPGITALDGRVYVLGGNLGERREVAAPLPLRPRARPLEATARRAHRPRRARARRHRPPPLRRGWLHRRGLDRAAARDLQRRPAPLDGRPEDADRAQPRRRRDLQARPGRHRRPAGPRSRRPDDGRALRHRARSLELATRSRHGAQRPCDRDRRRAARGPHRRLRRRGARRRDDDRAGRALRPATTAAGRRCRR